ncbi:helix-turn-helix domain-containing protein (plasmid) [Arthrobacter sp. UC242_113]|uniref:helix-turn-helix domain-containing protein n=1 Tax=Arthrobacter sp. UC242_113 TaxID=3374550 RepID=UPI003757BB6F
MTRWEVLAPHLHEGVPVARAAAAAGVPLRTARRWLSAYRARGLEGLAPRCELDRAVVVADRAGVPTGDPAQDRPYLARLRHPRHLVL